MQNLKYAQCTFRCFIDAHSVLAISWFLSACESKLEKVVKSTLSVLLSIVTKNDFSAPTPGFGLITENNDLDLILLWNRLVKIAE